LIMFVGMAGRIMLIAAYSPILPHAPHIRLIMMSFVLVTKVGSPTILIVHLWTTSQLFSKTTPKIIVYSSSTSLTFMTTSSSSAFMTETSTSCWKNASITLGI
jgi:hypothetical protein